MRHTFLKAEKLKSRKVIEQLFLEGKHAKKFPIKMVYLPLENEVKNKAAFSVPKRRFKLAVSRNRIKRQMREAYRLHKRATPENGTTFAVLFIYIHHKAMPYEAIEKAIKHLLKQLPYETS